MRILGLILAMMALAAPAMAQDWKTHPEDTPFNQEALTQRLSGQTLVFYDDGRSIFETDGKYNYTYGGGWHVVWLLGGQRKFGGLCDLCHGRRAL